MSLFIFRVYPFLELKEKGAELEKTLEETRKEITDVQNEKKTFMVRNVQEFFHIKIPKEIECIYC